MARLNLSRGAAEVWISEKIAKAKDPIRDRFGYVRSCLDNNGTKKAAPSLKDMRDLAEGKITHVIFDVGRPWGTP